ncbi:MAG: glycosyltransferase family 2 protein [Capsulimonadales bacterium]|nr:glycosyltransferase family 2 protein [Capsulimonadales bacterium]
MSTSAPKEKLVSVIIPTYNRRDLVQQAIESVRRQTYPHVEIIVVDDGSVDGTADILRNIPDIHFIRQKNQGQAGARNTGLAVARGQYISTLDSDDLWHSDFLEKCVGALETLDVDFVFANWISENIEKERSESYFEKHYRWWDFPYTNHPGWRLMERQPARDMYLDSCVSPSSALVFRREVMRNGWSGGLQIGDDWCLILDAILDHSCRVAFTMERLWLKRIDGNNIYDQRDHYEVKMALYLNDAKFMLNRYATRLTKEERARFYGHLAFHRFGMVKFELQRKHPHLALAHLSYCLINLARGMGTAPADAWAKIKSSRWSVRPPVEVPPDELERENLRPISPVGPRPGTT